MIDVETGKIIAVGSNYISALTARMAVKFAVSQIIEKFDKEIDRWYKKHYKLMEADSNKLE